MSTRFTLITTTPLQITNLPTTTLPAQPGWVWIPQIRVGIGGVQSTRKMPEITSAMVAEATEIFAEHGMRAVLEWAREKFAC